MMVTLTVSFITLITLRGLSYLIHFAIVCPDHFFAAGINTPIIHQKLPSDIQTCADSGFSYPELPFFNQTMHRFIILPPAFLLGIKVNMQA